MRKRTVALVFLALVGGLVLASLAVLRTRWAGDRICGLAAARLRAATGLPLEIASCRLDVLSFELDAEGLRLGEAETPVFTADRLHARLAPVQTLGSQVHLARLELANPRLSLQVPAGGAGGACPPPVLSRFQIQSLQVTGGRVDLLLPGGRRVGASGIEIASRPAERGLRALASAARRTRATLGAANVEVDTGDRRLRAAGVAADLEVALDLSEAQVRSASAEVDGVHLALEGRVRDLCAPRLDVTAYAEGPVKALLGLAGVASEAEGTAAVRAGLAGSPRAPAASATVRGHGVRVAGFVPGDFEATVRLAGDALAVEKLAVAAEGGVVEAKGTVRLGRGLPIEAEVRSTGVDLAEVLDRLGVTGPWVTVKLDARAKVSGNLWPTQLAGTLESDLHGFKALTRSWRDGAGDPGVLAFPAGRIATAVRVDRDGLSLDGARLQVGTGTLQADAHVAFHVDRGFRVRCRGEVDLAALGRISTVPWSGRATVEADVGAAPYGNPLITGRARVDGFHFLQVDLGAVAADFRYERFLLHLQGVEGTRNVTRYRGEAVVDLGETPVRIASARYEARGRLRDLFDAVMEWIPRTRYVREALDGDVEVQGTASGPAVALDADFDGRLGAGALLGRPFESGRARGKILAGRTTRFDRAELKRGAGTLAVAGTWGMELPFDWNLEASAAGLSLADLDLPGGGWTGSASGTARLEGSWVRPRVRFALNGDAVTVRGVELGTVQAGGTLLEKKLLVTGGAEGISFGGEARLEGRLPFKARAQVALEDAARLLPGKRPPGLRARVAGEATAEGDLEDLEQARANATFSALSLSYTDLRVEAAGPAQLAARGGRIELSPLTLRGANTELVIAGTSAPGGTLDATASGTLDLRLIGGFFPALRRWQGQLALDAHVGGTFDAPVLVGAGRLAEAGFQLRSAVPVAVTAGQGALAFSQNRVLFDGLTALVNGGRATLRGEVELDRLAPARLRVDGTVEDVPVAVIPSLPAVFTGRLEAEGTPEATNVTGRLHVTRARYTQNVNLEGSLLELRRRRPPPPPRAYDRAEEWLRFDIGVAVDGDVRVDNDLVRGPLAGELTLTGTLAAPGVVGSVAMGEGSRVVFRGNDFILTHAVLDFTDRRKVEIALDVTGESQVRDYQVLMRVTGSLYEPQVTLNSIPSLPQQDIITLLSLGFTRRDAAAGAGVQGVATAAAAQAIFSASGLDEQVRRFLPRGGPIRDLSMRITSAYSEETGQVEPRAEFESWILRDRLRLRLQSPLGGARGRKAQAELRLGEHTALQYQWDNDNPDLAPGDHGLDLKLRWEWNDER